MTTGDIYWVDLPSGAGHVQSGRRPAIIFQGTNANADLPTVLIIPLTTQIDALRFPATILVETDADNGLRRNSVAPVFQLTALDQQFVRDRMGIVSESILTAIWEELEFLADR